MTRGEASDFHVLMVSTSYPADRKDWRGRFIADMATALRPKVRELSLWMPNGDLPPGSSYVASEEDQAWLSELLKQGGVAHLLRNRPFRGLKLAISLLKRLSSVYKSTRADIIHVNWLQNALPLNSSSKPVIVTVLGSDYRLLELPGMTTLIRRALAARPVVIAPNAAWMVPGLEQRFGDIAEIRPIPFGVDQRWFAVRRQPVSPHKWIAVTRITRDKIGDLFSWGEGLFSAYRELHLFGPMQEKMALPNWIIWHGPTNPDELATDWLPYATGLITLSQHSEGRPQIVLEAMAAGLPVVVSDLPAHRDVVVQGETGWITNSQATLKAALEQAEDIQMNRQIGENAQFQIREKIGDWSQCADRYTAAYRDLLART